MCNHRILYVLQSYRKFALLALVTTYFLYT